MRDARSLLILGFVLAAGSSGAKAFAGPDKPPDTPPRQLPALDLLVVAPHSDDEAIGCTGVMLQAIAKGERVGVIVVTQGDGFPKAAAAVAKKAEDQLTPADFRKLGALRQRHTLKAMGGIGVCAEDIMFLGYPDSDLTEIYGREVDKPFRQKFTEKCETYGEAAPDYHWSAHGKPAPYVKAGVIGDLVEIIKARRPKLIYVTHEADQHPDHRATYWFVRDAAKAADFRGKLLTFVVHGKGPEQAPDVRVKLSKQEQNRKRVTIEEYQAGVSPVHDHLAEEFARAEEVFWLAPLK